MINFQKTEFVQSFTRKNDGSAPALPEVIFIGRSNVGKSSLINALINRKNLAYTSKKPGYTKLLNYFLVDDSFYLVDAPGYGYAKTGKRISDDFARMMDDYFKENINLKQIYLLIDARRDLTKEDQEFIDYIAHFNLPYSIIFTKDDKLNQSQKAKALNMYYKMFPHTGVKPLFTSSLKKANIKALQEHIMRVIKK